MDDNFSTNDLLEKIGPAPKCYLTGEDIDINQTDTYSFDHILPASKGGLNSLDNLGICTKQANLAKHDLSPKEFFDLCQKVLEHQGYEVTPPMANGTGHDPVTSGLESDILPT